MTDSRINDIENVVLVGLVEASEHGEKPFKIDEKIFANGIKRRLAMTINKYIDSNEPELIQFRVINAIDNDKDLHQSWIEINEKTSSVLPISTIKKYYDTLVEEYKNMILKGAM